MIQFPVLFDSVTMDIHCASFLTKLFVFFTWTVSRQFISSYEQQLMRRKEGKINDKTNDVARNEFMNTRQLFCWVDSEGIFDPHTHIHIHTVKSFLHVYTFLCKTSN